MGIRIHKMLGYALTDVIADTKKWEITDPRFNKDGYMFDMEEVSFSVDGYKAHLAKKILKAAEDEGFDLRLMLRAIERDEDEKYSNRSFRNIYESVNYDMEFGDSNVIVFIPPSCTREWNRYDDAIDYYDPGNSSDDGGIENSIIHIDRALWPWDSYVNTTTIPPVRLNSKQHQMYNVWNNGHVLPQEVDRYAQKIGVANSAELSTNIAPIIPDELVELIKYLKIFTDDKYIYDLRPVIYGYWG